MPPRKSEIKKGITMTSKQRAYLKSLAMTMEPIFQIGKNSMTPRSEERRVGKEC